MNRRWILPGACMLVLACLQYCTGPAADDQFYKVDDYTKVEKYDVHVHINTYKPDFINLARSENFRLVSLNVGAPGYPTIPQQQDYTTFQVKAFPGELAYTTTFDVAGWNDSDWQAKTLAYLDESFKRGAIGVKVWKNIGMSLKDSAGKFVMIDNPRFDTIISFISSNDKTLVGHLGEPKNCWLPLDEMTVKNDRSYFKTHPEYHMALHPEYPSYQNQIDARDNMLRKHPHLRFDGAHLASLEWNVDSLAARLDEFPDMAVDMAARISHLQYQSLKDYKKVYDFLIKYQDRLMYATDLVVDDTMDSTASVKHWHDTRFNDWKYFVSDETMEAPEVEGKFKALHLPSSVVDKIYKKNAEKWFPGFTKSGR